MGICITSDWIRASQGPKDGNTTYVLSVRRLKYFLINIMIKDYFQSHRSDLIDVEKRKVYFVSLISLLCYLFKLLSSHFFYVLIS